jgi:hypothetical protein
VVVHSTPARVWVGNARCYPFPDRLTDARKPCTPKGRCKVGWIVSRGGRESWDVWLEVRTGLVKLIEQVNATAGSEGRVFTTTAPTSNPTIAWHPHIDGPRSDSTSHIVSKAEKRMGAPEQSREGLSSNSNDLTGAGGVRC